MSEETKEKIEKIKQFLKDNWFKLSMAALNLIGFAVLGRRTRRNAKNIRTLSGNCDLDAGVINSILTKLEAPDDLYIYNSVTGERY